MICKNTLLYHAIPILQNELTRNGSLVNGQPSGGNGINGKVMFPRDPFHGTHLITKVPLTDYRNDSSDLLRELFTNFVILNQYLLTHPNCTTLVPTYGFFMCNKNNDSSQVCDAPKRLDGLPNIFIIQKRMQGQTFFDVLNQVALYPLIRIKRIISKMMRTLIDLSEGVYQLTHFDLHSQNILIENPNQNDPNPLIIDWGMSSFSFQGRRITNFLEDRYLNKTPIISGAYDMNFILNELIRFSTNQIHPKTYHYTVRVQPHLQLDQWARNMHRRIFHNQFKSNVHVPFTSNEYDNYLIKKLTEVERTIKNKANRQQVHVFNLQRLNQLTYRYIYQEMCLEDPEFANL